MMTSTSARILSAAATLIVSGAAGYVLASAWQLEGEASPEVLTADSTPAVDSLPRNPFADRHGTNLIVFVVAASDCGWSSRPATMDAIGSIRDKMRSQYNGSFAKVTVVGVILDQDVETGLRFASELGNGQTSHAFDQIVIGGSWLNEQLVRFVWREEVARAATPQVVVIERPIDASAYLSTFTLTIGSDRVLANPSGSDDIEHWIQQGMPLDSET